MDTDGSSTRDDSGGAGSSISGGGRRFSSSFTPATRRRDSAGVVNDVARLETAGATSCRSRQQRPSQHGGVVGAPGPSRWCRRTTRRRWSAPDHGVSSTVDRRQLTTRCRFSSGHALRSSSSLSQFTQRTSVLNSD